MSESPMEIGALAAWFGNKRRQAPLIAAQGGPHHSSFENFCGGMAFTLAKPPCTLEVVNDLHGDLTNLARIIRDPLDSPRLYRRLRRTLCSEELFTEATAALEGDLVDPFERAYFYFIQCWLGRNGTAGTKEYNHSFCARFKPGGGGPGKRWQSAITSIPAWRRRLARVIITRKCGLAMLDKIADRKGVLIYVDPPYRVKGATYLYDFKAETDEAGPSGHEVLRSKVDRFKKARVIVSYYRHPEILELYKGWTVYDCPINKAMANANPNGEASKKKSVAPEMLLINGPSLIREDDPGIFAAVDDEDDA